MIQPEIKYLIEDYVEAAARFQDILAFYENSNVETKKYFGERFENLTGRKFEEVFGPLLKRSAAKKTEKKKKSKQK
ncbi:MAG: hypothetical protein QXV32_05140 [Conexivisphaerales archaeon]